MSIDCMTQETTVMGTTDGYDINDTDDGMDTPHIAACLLSSAPHCCEI